MKLFCSKYEMFKPDQSHIVMENQIVLFFTGKNKMIQFYAVYSYLPHLLATL